MEILYQINKSYYELVKIGTGIFSQNNISSKQGKMNKSVGFIGGGRITRIIVQAFKYKNQELDKVFVYDVNRETSKKLNQDYPQIKIRDLSITSACDIVFIALHPPVIPETLELIKNNVKKETILVSMAPKITISNISSILNNKNIVRFYPNATSIINKGYNPVSFAGGFKEKQEILELLSLLGKTIETEEAKLEAYAVTSGLLPTYLWFQLYELIEIGRQIGLSGLESKEAIETTLYSAVEVMFKSGLTKEEVLDLISLKPFEENENQILKIYKSKLIGFFTKIKPVYEPIL
jgi:pyrroline-5-carboxylate reductase